MELIVISASKLKIMLTEADMERYALDGGASKRCDEPSREVFLRILEDARAGVGFERGNARLFIQFYASKEGGGEMFVTKLDDGHDICGSCYTNDFGGAEQENASPQSIGSFPAKAVGSFPLEAGERKLLGRIYEAREEERVDHETSRTAVFGFDQLPHLLAASRRLATAGYAGKSDLYIQYEPCERWYLTLTLPTRFGARLPSQLCFLSEYGTEADGDRVFLYLDEHGRLLRKGDAVSTLAGL